MTDKSRARGKAGVGYSSSDKTPEDLPRVQPGPAPGAKPMAPVTTERLLADEALRTLHQRNDALRHTVVYSIRNATVPPQVREVLMMQSSALLAVESAITLMQQQIDNLTRKMGTR